MVDNFDTIVASENLNVFVSQAKKIRIIVEADENSINFIGADSNNGRLHLYTLKNMGRTTKKIYVSIPKVAALINSSGSVLQT